MKSVLSICSILAFAVWGQDFLESRGVESAVHESSVSGQEDPTSGHRSGRSTEGDGVDPVLAEASPGRESGEIEVLIVAAGSGLPISGARISVVPTHRLMRSSWNRAAGSWDALKVFEEAPEVARSDVDGRARVQLPEVSSVIGAFTEQAFGRSFLLSPERDRSATIELSPFCRVSLAVVNDAGEAQPHAAVALHQSMPGMSEDLLPVGFAHARTRTDRDGRASLRCIEESPRRESDEPIRHYACLEGIFESPVSRRFDPGTISEEPIQLEIPEAVILAIRILGPDGTLHAGAVHVSAGIVDPRKARPAKDMSRIRWASTFSGGQSKDVLASPASRVQLFVHDVEKEHFVAIEEVIETRKEPGTRQEIELRFKKVMPRLRARLTDAAGNPLGNRRLQLSHGSRHMASNAYHDLETDAEGRISMALGPRFELPDRRRWLGVEVLADGAHPSAMGQLDVPKTALLDDIDLGDVALIEETLLVSGIVVDHEGQPVADCRVYADDPGTNVSDSTMVEEDGRFALQGYLENETETGLEIEIRTRCEGYAVTTARVRRGDQDVRLVLRRESRISGRLVIPPGFATSDYRLSLRDQKGTQRRGEIEDDGSFAFEALESGSYIVEVGAAHDPDLVIHTFPGVKLGIGQSHVLPAAELRAAGERLHIRLRRPAATKDEFFGEIEVHEPGIEEPTGIHLVSQEDCEFLVSRTPVDLVITINGCRRKRVSGLRAGKHEIALDPGIPVSLHTKIDFPISESWEVQYSLVGWLEPHGGTSIEGRVAVPMPGEYRVMVLFRDRRFKERFEYTMGFPDTIQVRDSATEQVFDIELRPTDELKQILSR